MNEAYNALANMEQDLNKALNLAYKLKHGISRQSISTEKQVEMINQIIEEIQR